MAKLVRYTGTRQDKFGVVRDGTTYWFDGPGTMLSVDDKHIATFPRQFFEVVTAPDPEKIKTKAEPLEQVVTIDPTDGISDQEAVAAEQVLRSYRKEKLGEKQDRIMAVDSTDPQDYVDAARDD